MAVKTKIEVGQTWTHNDGTAYTITRISQNSLGKRDSWYFNKNQGKELHFLELNGGDYPIGYTDVDYSYWTITKAVTSRIKFEVGQTWTQKRDIGNGRPYTITRIGKDSYGDWTAYYEEKGIEHRFGTLDSSHYLDAWDDSDYAEWDVIQPGAKEETKAVTPIVPQKSLFEFFKAVKPGNCGCDVPKELCTYHR